MTREDLRSIVEIAVFTYTIRGVHYCTTWTPAYAYTYLLGTICG